MRYEKELIRNVFVILLAGVLLLSACTAGESQTAPQTGAETSVPSAAETVPVPAGTTELSSEPVIAKKGSLLEEPAVGSAAGKTFAGWYGDGIAGKWIFEEDTVEKSMTLTAVWTDPVARQATALDMHDVKMTSASLNETNAAVVLFLSFTDGYVCDREQFESFFTAEYGQEQALESVSTYFGLTSYGKASFDFYFYYYDTGMSCKEAYNYADETGYEMVYEAFREAQDSYPGDPKDWDRNGDGYVDLFWLVTGEDPKKTVGDGKGYFIYSTASPTLSIWPDPEKPVIYCFSKVPYENMLMPATPARQTGGLRTLIHETSHLFGLIDYYNRTPYEDEETFDTLGTMDMQSHNFGDWNVYSRFSCGWLDPYVIDGTQETVTLKIGCSSEVPDAILIPTAAGWNGTAFDEYILIDVLAPYAANGFDWPKLYHAAMVKADDPRMGGRCESLSCGQPAGQSGSVGYGFQPAGTDV